MTRLWEVDDIKALPGDIVREQDFIMRLRQLNRQSQTTTIINIAFGGLPALQADVEKREAITRALAPTIKQLNGQLHVMSQGDIFIIAPDAARAHAAIAAACHEQALHDDAEIGKLLQTYQLPQEYAAARERTNHYIESARASAQIGAANPSPEVALHGEQVRGALTPWALDQIVKLFATIDIRRYVRNQNIYRQTEKGWQQISAEYFVSVEELRRERFPRLDIRTPERLFMELCNELDHRLLEAFADQPASLASGPLHLNIGVESVLGSAFAKFTHSIAPEQRKLMTFEINRGDMLLNFDATLAAMALLRQEGYQIALDAMHPGILPFVNCTAFDVDFVKIRFGKDRLVQLQDPAVIAALRHIPKEKIIVYRCEDETAVKVAEQLGISLFQGWFIDDIATAS